MYNKNIIVLQIKAETRAEDPSTSVVPVESSAHVMRITCRIVTPESSPVESSPQNLPPVESSPQNPPPVKLSPQKFPLEE